MANKQKLEALYMYVNKLITKKCEIKTVGVSLTGNRYMHLQDNWSSLIRPTEFFVQKLELILK